MSSSVREVKTKFTFDVESDKLDKINQALEGVKHRLEFLGGIELAKGLFELSEKFSKFAENIHVAATSAGITVESFQKLAFAAKQSAVPQEQLEVSLARLSRSLYHARQGSEEAIKSFQQAGFTTDQVKGFRTAQDALLALGDNLKGIDDPIKRVALAQALLGRGSQRMVGFLAQGSDAIKGLGKESDKLGIALSEHQVEALVRAERALQKFWGVIQAIGATIAAYFAPELESAIKSILEFYEANRKIINTNIKKWVEDFAFSLGFVYGILKELVRLAILFAKQFGVENSILPTVAKLVGLIGGLILFGRVVNFIGNSFTGIVRSIQAVRTAMIALTAVEWAAALPWIAIAAAVAALAYALNRLVGQFTGKSILERLGGIGGISNFAGNGLLQLASGGVLGTTIPSSIAGASAITNSQSSQVQILAPITQNITGSDSSEIAARASKGLTDHVSSTQNRAIRRGVTSNKAY